MGNYDRRRAEYARMAKEGKMRSWREIAMAHDMVQSLQGGILDGFPSEQERLVVKAHLVLLRWVLCDPEGEPFDELLEAINNVAAGAGARFMDLATATDAELDAFEQLQAQAFFVSQMRSLGAELNADQEKGGSDHD